MEEFDDDLLATDRGLDGRTTSLEGSLAHQLDLPTGLTAAFVELVELVLFLVGVEEGVPRREEVEDAGFGNVGKEEAASALDIGGLGVGDGHTKSSREVFAEDGGRIGADGRLVHHRGAGELRFVDYDVDVIDIVLEEDRSAMDNDLNAKFGRESAMVDSDQDEGGRGRLANYADSEGVENRALHLLLEQVTTHSRTDSVLPDLIETVRPEGSQLLGNQVRLGTRLLHPDVGAGASDKVGLGGKAIEVMLRLNLGRNVGGIGVRVRGSVVGKAYGDGGMDVRGRHNCDTRWNKCLGARHWRRKTRKEEIRTEIKRKNETWLTQRIKQYMVHERGAKSATRLSGLCREEETELSFNLAKYRLHRGETAPNDVKLGPRPCLRSKTDELQRTPDRGEVLP